MDLVKGQFKFNIFHEGLKGKSSRMCVCVHESPQQLWVPKNRQSNIRLAVTATKVNKKQPNSFQRCVSKQKRPHTLCWIFTYLYKNNNNNISPCASVWSAIFLLFLRRKRYIIHVEFVHPKNVDVK